jgi:hypothetical protein
MLGCARPGADRAAALSRFGGDVLLPSAALPRVCWCREPVDLRKGHARPGIVGGADPGARPHWGDAGGLQQSPPAAPGAEIPDRSIVLSVTEAVSMGCVPLCVPHARPRPVRRSSAPAEEDQAVETVPVAAHAHQRGGPPDQPILLLTTLLASGPSVLSRSRGAIGSLPIRPTAPAPRPTSTARMWEAHQSAGPWIQVALA